MGRPALRLRDEADLKACRRCGKRQYDLYSRGLCIKCFKTPGVRSQYRTLRPTRQGRQGDPEQYQGPSLPCQRTDERPGTLGHEAVMRERLARGEALTHPQDGPPADPLEPSALELSSYRNRGRYRTCRAHADA